jgi:hypothetical protein
MAISNPVLTTAQPVSAGALSDATASSAICRRISPQAGRALEILGHAIEYLTDEYVYRGGGFHQGDPKLEAIHLLMAANRSIYFECPEVPTFPQRCLRFFGFSRS